MDNRGYEYKKATPSESHDYILPKVKWILEGLGLPSEGRRLFELGCGNGHVAAELSKVGWKLTGVDPSIAGIRIARSNHPQVDLHEGSTEEDLAGRFGRFPVVLSIEVVEHVYAPREYARRVFDLLEEGGTAVLTTPYHGYFKNLALAITGKMDTHFTALWDHGHIKFWSFRTLKILLEEAGFDEITFHRVGRIPLLAKSMIAVARKGPVRK